jgi:hypothetical protein
MRASFAPIFQSKVEDTLRLALRAAEDQTIRMLFERRQFCLDYYHNEVRLEDGGVNAYLKNYSGYVDKDGIWTYKNTLLLEHVNLTEQIIDLKSKNYSEQPLRLVDDEEAEGYTDLLKRSKWFATSKRIEQYTNLLHDIAVGVFLDEKTKLLRFQVIPEYYPIFDEDDPIQTDPVAIIHPTAKRDARTGGVVWAYYDDKVTCDLNNMGEVVSEMKPNTYGVFNFLFPHRKHPVLSHFSTPAVSLCDANQAVDAALTALNQALHYNAHKQMVMTGKVSKDNEKGQEVKFALGNAQVILIDPSMDGQKTGVDVIDMQVQFEPMIAAIKAKMEMVANSYNVQFQWKIEGGPQSGVSLDIQNSRDHEDRGAQFEILEDYVEQPLYAIVKAIGAKFNIPVEDGELSLDFVEEKGEMPVSDKIAWQKWMKESGEWDLKKQIMENNPELSETDAQSRADEMMAKKKERADMLTPDALKNAGKSTDQTAAPNMPDGMDKQMGAKDGVPG